MRVAGHTTLLATPGGRRSNPHDPRVRGQEEQLYRAGSIAGAHHDYFLAAEDYKQPKGAHRKEDTTAHTCLPRKLAPTTTRSHAMTSASRYTTPLEKQ